MSVPSAPTPVGLSTEYSGGALTNWRQHCINCDLAESMRSKNEELHLRNVYNLYREAVMVMLPEQETTSEKLLSEATAAVEGPSSAWQILLKAEIYMQKVLRDRGFKFTGREDPGAAVLKGG